MYCPRITIALFVSHLPPLVVVKALRAGRRTVTNRLVFILFKGTLVILRTLPKYFFLKQVDRYTPQSNQPSPPVPIEVEGAEGGGGPLSSASSLSSLCRPPPTMPWRLSMIPCDFFFSLSFSGVPAGFSRWPILAVCRDGGLTGEWIDLFGMDWVEFGWMLDWMWYGVAIGMWDRLRGSN